MRFIRTNPMGLTYHISRENDTQTRIVCNRKILIVDMPIDEISQCWYNWQMQGAFIQDAFSKLTNQQREFLITAITPAEWDNIFEKKDE